MFSPKEPWLIVFWRLTSLRNFVDHVAADVNREIEDIERRSLSGEFADHASYEGAFNFPIARHDITVRAIAYEVVALVESHLQALANVPWLQSGEYKGPKGVGDLRHINPESLSRIRTVSELPFAEVIRLVEEHHRIHLADLPGWQRLTEIRDIVNSFKHRGGWKRPNEINWWKKGFDLSSFKNEIGLNEAYGILDEATSFLRALSDIGQSTI